jgi:hypothetical protein
MKIILGFLLLVAIPGHSQEQEAWAACTAMPKTTVAEKQARSQCIAASNAREDAKRRAVAYTITLYTPNSEKLTWVGRDLLSVVDGLEFTDSVNGHRIRVFGTFTIESSTGEITDSEKDDED